MSAIHHLALFEDFSDVLRQHALTSVQVHPSGRIAGQLVLNEDDIERIARRMVHLVVLHGLLPEISARVPSTNRASVPTNETSTS